MVAGEHDQEGVETILTVTLSSVAEYLVNKFEEQKGPLELEDVYYGDQQKIPRYVSLCVQPDTHDFELAGAPRRVLSVPTIMVMVYHGQLQSVQANLLECDQHAYRIAEAINTDDDLGGMIIHGYVTKVESGSVQRGSSPVRATRLTYQATAKELLP